MCGDRNPLHSNPEFAAVRKEGDASRALVTAPERDDAVALAGVEPASGVRTQISFAKATNAMAICCTTLDCWELYCDFLLDQLPICNSRK